MHRIHLEKVDSTNNHLRRLIDRGEAGDGLLLVDTDEQYAGRGQRGNSWESETGKNLSFSVLCHPQRIVPSRQFAISEAMALAVVETLAGLEGTTNPEKSRFSVKWPNDIYYDDKKICGTLIECDLQGKTIRNCIIGTGLNVNQTCFVSDAPNPVSLSQIFGREFNRETLLNQIVCLFEKHFMVADEGDTDLIHASYKRWLYRRAGLHAYEDAQGCFEAEIADVEPNGYLLLRDTENRLRRYEFKEVKYLKETETMNDPRHIRIADYNYDLPDGRIAKYPLSERDASKLLVYNHGEVSEDHFTSLPDYLPAGSLMVFNNTKVIQARLRFQKATGATIEVFCMEPFLPLEYQQNFASKGECQWLCMIGNLKRWKEGVLTMPLTISGLDVLFHAERLSKPESANDDGTKHLVRFSWDAADVAFSEVLEACGEIPIPPYLNRRTEESDSRTYQTVYSKVKGSVAAPTAGLHFTERVLHALDEKGIDREELTLHVGAGTFKPVKSEEIAGHDMHSEYIVVKRQTIEKLIAHGGEATAVGTTSVRTLESLYYIGRELETNPDLSEEELHVDQWEPYDGSTSTQELTLHYLQNIKDYLERNGLEALHTSTQIIIAPGYEYHIVRRMVTNFHQPQSTLLLLVSAFVNGDWHTIYDYALSHDFRFLSYGDSSLLIP